MPTINRQGQILMAALRNGPVSTIDARKVLDIMMPATRVFELRHDHGFNIVTQIVQQKTDAGKAHNVAFYVLLPGKFKNVDDTPEPDV